MAKVTISFNQAIGIQNIIVQQRGGQLIKSDLAKAKGKTGTSVYHLRHDIREAFKPLNDQRDGIIQDFQALEQEKKEASKKRLSEIEKEQQELEDQLAEIGLEEKEITLTKGKLKHSEIEDFVDTIECEVLEPFIDFDS